MDWMDDYLNGIGEYKTTVSPADTHIWGPAKPSKLQQSLIQDSMAYDVQQMRLIQEARQELERHGAALGIGADPGSPTVQTPQAQETCTDEVAQVLMTGSNEIWDFGPRLLTQLVPGYNPWGTGWTYEYGDEVVRNLDGVWIYENVNPENPLGEIARSYSPVAWPWLATWPDFIATKVCP
jgi:hypothetical protein